MKPTPVKEFFCALCRTPRRLHYHRHLQAKHYLQIFVLSAVLVYSMFSVIHWKGLVLIPIVWLCFEVVYKMLYRRQLPCPSCGFDPTWYRRDVRLARQRVEEFMKQNPQAKFVDPKTKQNTSSQSSSSTYLQ